MEDNTSDERQCGKIPLTDKDRMRPTAALRGKRQDRCWPAWATMPGKAALKSLG